MNRGIYRPTERGPAPAIGERRITEAVRIPAKRVEVVETRGDWVYYREIGSTFVGRMRRYLWNQQRRSRK